MTFPTLRKRLEQIREYDLPYDVFKGNRLPKQSKKDSYEIEGGIREAGQLENGLGHKVSEFAWEQCARARNNVFEDNSPTPFGFSLDLKYAKSLALAAGDASLIEEFKLKEYMDSCHLNEKTEVHAIYDPHQDVTHFFLLPHIKMTKQ